MAWLTVLSCLLQQASKIPSILGWYLMVITDSEISVVYKHQKSPWNSAHCSFEKCAGSHPCAEIFLGAETTCEWRKAKRCFHLVFIRAIKERFNLLDRCVQHFWILWVSHLAPTIPKGCQCPTASMPYVLSHGNVPAASRLAQDTDVSGNELFLSFPADLWCLNVSFACSQRSLAGGRRLEECPADVEIPSLWVFFIHLCIQLCLEQGGGLETCRDPFQPQLLSSVQQKMQISPKPKMLAFAPEQITDFHSVTLRCFFLLTSEYKH